MKSRPFLKTNEELKIILIMMIMMMINSISSVPFIGKIYIQRYLAPQIVIILITYLQENTCFKACFTFLIDRSTEQILYSSNMIIFCLVTDSQCSQKGKIIVNQQQFLYVRITCKLRLSEDILCKLHCI